MADWMWLGIGVVLLAATGAFLLAMDRRDEKRRLVAERQRPSLRPVVECEPPPPIDFSEALRRRGRR